jgi:ferredoxin-type protein NapH
MRRQTLRKTLLVVSAALLPVTLNYFSPYLMTSGAAAGVLTASVFVWAAWSAAAVVVGRAGCGWVCPLGGVQHLCDKAERGRRLVRIPGLGYLRWALWAVWMSAVAVLLLRYADALQADFLYMTPHYVSVDTPPMLITLVMIVALAAVPALALGRHAFCRYLCPFAPFNVIGWLVGRVVRVPQLHLELTGATCSRCGDCTSACPMSLPVQQMVADDDLRRTDCIMCGSCADGCRRDVIAYRFGTPRSPGS